MKRNVAVAIVLTVSCFFVLRFPMVAEAVVIEPTFGSTIAADTLKLARAGEVIAEMQARLPGNKVVRIEITEQAMGQSARPERFSDEVYVMCVVRSVTEASNILAFTCCVTDSLGYPKIVSIRINSSANIWWGSNPPVNGSYDAIAILRHELTHALGMYFGAYSHYSAHIVPGPRFVGCGSLDVALASQDPSHLDYATYPGNNMNQFLSPNTRSPISDIAISMLRCAFGSFYEPDTLAHLRGMVWNDIDGDSVKDVAEPGLVGWAVSNGTDTALTDAQGNYSFLNLSPGTYTVTAAPESGWTQTAPSTGSYTVSPAPGETVSGLAFGNLGPPCCPKGDLDGNWLLTGTDVVLILNQVFLGIGSKCQADMDGDGVFSAVDVVKNLNCVFLGLCPPCP